MSTPAEQAALGYFLAWLEAKQDEHGAIVRAFGAIRNEDGGIHSVRVKVFDTVLSMRPMQPPPDARAQASDIRPASDPVEAMMETAMASRPNYGGAERYRCPSCGARQWDWCVTKTGTQSYRPHSAREHMVT